VQRSLAERKLAKMELRASRERLRALAARLQAVREEERTFLAREIHDVLAQDLTRLKFDLVWLERRLTQPGQGAAARSLVARVAEMNRMADTVLHCVQRIATGLRPVVLDSLGLCAAVEWQARDFQDHSKIQCHASVPADELTVGRDVATATFRILQECLTNVQRHAHATRVEVSLRQAAGQLLLRVEDNGRGIRAQQLRDPRSIGLVGMRERALLLGGQLEIRSHPGAGTVIEMRIPLRAGAPFGKQVR
jgi:signal transduction histidine kinase